MGALMSAVLIGIDPHKASHTAVALDGQEVVLGQLRVRACAMQAEQLMTWAQRWPERSWAIEGALGLGYLLAQELAAAGERVVDVQPKLAARIRLLNTKAVNKNDPNDARSVAVAAVRSSDLPVVAAEDHATVMRVWVRRRRDLSRTRNRTVNRLHTVLCELVPGGFAGELSARQAAALLDTVQPIGAAATARHDLACEIVDDLRRIDTQLREVRTRLTQLILAAKTSTVEIFGVGPVVAAMVVGHTGDITRFANADRFAAYTGTAPIEASSGPHKVYRLSRRGNRQLNHAIHIVAVTQIRYRHSPGRAYYDRKIAEGKSPKMALRALKRRISDTLYRAMLADVRAAMGTREGNRGTALSPARPAPTPHASSSDKPLPGHQSA
jgi:transposase